METEERDAVQNRFMASTDAVVVATIAFGMGIDKSDIRAVYHFNLPKSLENYAQEIGRAGRDGRPAECEILAAAEDLTVLENFIYGDTPTPEALRDLLKGLLLGRAAGDCFDCSVHELAARNDIRPLVVSTALTYLEIDGVIEATAPFYTEYKWRYQRSVDDILGRFDARRREFLELLFRQGKQGRIWNTLAVAEAAAALGGQRERMVNALTYLDEKGDIELRAAGVRQGYRVVSVPEDLPGLWREMRRRFAVREAADIARVGAVVGLIADGGCLVRRLLEYFGEDIGRECGHCGSCEGAGPVVLKRSATVERWPADELAALCAEHPRALGGARQITRFLCGIGSPALTAAKLTRHPLFGHSSESPFAAVIAVVKSERAGTG
jgi:ATP-dependent DNA helicase RecQ